MGIIMAPELIVAASLASIEDGLGRTTYVPVARTPADRLLSAAQEHEPLRIFGRVGLDSARPALSILSGERNAMRLIVSSSALAAVPWFKGCPGSSR